MIDQNYHLYHHYHLFSPIPIFSTTASKPTFLVLKKFQCRKFIFKFFLVSLPISQPRTPNSGFKFNPNHPQSAPGGRSYSLNG